MIIRCERCSAWIASNNDRIMEEHRDECNICKTQDVIRFKINHNHKKVARCIVELSNIRFRAIILHLQGGRFRIINTALPDYRNLVGKVIDASDIYQVL